MAPPLEHVEAGRRAQFEDYRTHLILTRDELEVEQPEEARRVQAELTALDAAERTLRGLPPEHNFDRPPAPPQVFGFGDFFLE